MVTANSTGAVQCKHDAFNRTLYTCKDMCRDKEKIYCTMCTGAHR